MRRSSLSKITLLQTFLLLHVPHVSALQASVLPFIIKAIVPYSIYCFSVEKYAKRVVKKMQDTPTISSLQNDDASAGNLLQKSIDPKQLRQTVNKRNNLVVDPKDRVKWNKYIAKAISSKETQSSRLVPECGKYQFAYRSYANKEEANAYIKPFFTWKRFISLMMVDPTTIYVSKEDENNMKLLLVEHFSICTLIRFKIHRPGKIIKHNDGKVSFHWERNDLIRYWLYFKKKKSISNPTIPKSLDPWDIIKYDDGMICVKMNDLGYLMFDRIEQINGIKDALE